MTRVKIEKLLLWIFTAYLCIYVFLHFSRCFGTCARQQSNAWACIKNQISIQKAMPQVVERDFNLSVGNYLEFYKAINIESERLKDPGFGQVATYRSDNHGNVWCINHGKGWTKSQTCTGTLDNKCNQRRANILDWYEDRFTLYKSALIYMRDKLNIDLIEDSSKL